MRRLLLLPLLATTAALAQGPTLTLEQLPRPTMPAGERGPEAGAQDAYWPTHGWRKSSPEAQGLDSEALAALFEYVRDHGTRIHSLTIVRNGHIVLDAYFWPFQNGQVHDTASVTKAVTTTLVGIAVGKQAFTGLSQSLPSLFNGRAMAHLDDRKRRLTLKHLMSMTSGLNCHSDPGEATLRQMRESRDWTQFMLDLPMRDEPGSRFEYCSGGMHLLSSALTRATGVSALEFARRELFAPLGIGNAVWPADAQGISFGWGDLRLQPRDMAKLGYLWLNRGRWDDRQIVPNDWMEAAVRPQAQPPNTNQTYGYGLWLHDERRPAEFEAVGRGGQRIAVVPAKGLVVVFTGGTFEPGEIGPFIWRALKSDQPLPENPSGTARLAAAVNAAATPPPSPPASFIPSLAKAVSGRRYVLAANPLKLRSFSLTFEGTANPQLELEIGDLRDGPRPIGLGGVAHLSPGGPSGLPVAVSGAWDSEDSFTIYYDEVAAINAFQIRLRFTGNDVDVTLSERSQVITSTSFRGTSVR